MFSGFPVHMLIGFNHDYIMLKHWIAYIIYDKQEYETAQPTKVQPDSLRSGIFLSFLFNTYMYGLIQVGPLTIAKDQVVYMSKNSITRVYETNTTIVFMR